MGARRVIVNFFLKGVLDTLCKIDSREFREALAKHRPLIIAINHINFLEVPILVTHSYPLNVTGMVNAEAWKNRFFAFLFNTYQAVPIDRRGAFQDAFRRVKELVDSGFCVCIAPEGTRSKDGVLGKGKAGIIQLALDSGAPILPVAHYGGEHIWENIRRLRRTPFKFRTGRPFRIKCEGRPDKEVREEIVGEVMGQIARLLPSEMRGIYSSQAEAESKYLDFI